MPLGSGVRKPWGREEYAHLLGLLSRLKVDKFYHFRAYGLVTRVKVGGDDR